MAEISGWFVVGIKKFPMKGVVMWHINIRAACQMRDTWPVARKMCFAVVRWTAYVKYNGVQTC